LLGHLYRGRDGGEMRGVGLVDLETVAGDRRMIGNISVRCRLGGRETVVVGFENHAGRTRLGAGVNPLGTVLHGFGNNGEDGGEGVHQGRLIGTYVHGPLLPKNPGLADHLIAIALERRHGPVALAALDDDVEQRAHAAALAIASG
ncbi:MAG TPA: hypothetical protein VMU66_08905, partial [Gaiellales bacterium]|nr:hypothetical protein [Gaiellales bacterium]